MATNSALAGTLTSEINDRPFLGVLAVLVVLLHLLVLLRLLTPNDQDKINKPPKVVEVVLLKPEPVIPKEKAAPPAPAPAPLQPPKPKVVTPKKPPPKKVEKPKPVVKKEAVAQKKPELTKPEPKMADRVSIFPSPAISSQKPSLSTSSSARPSTKPVAKPGNGDARSKGVNSNAVPLGKVTPAYPMRAKSRNIEGWVKISLTVSASGAVSNPSVIGASPPGIFDDAALSAIRKMRFKPKLVDGKAVSSTATQTFRFSLSNR